MKTVEKETIIIFEEKKSKFIGYIKPVSEKLEAELFIKKIKEKHNDANHNCSVYKVIDNGQEFFKVDDDGEPSGTAGKPMGDIVTYMGVSNLVIVATRYFGGIKLGAGGLIRNYAKTAKLAIQESGIIEYIKMKKYILEFSYDKIGEIDSVLSNHSIENIEKGYNENVIYKLELNENILDKIREISGILIVEL
ncbi:IMPACT family protein [Fusobacterium sp. PH5-44]|uniref:IMPACT family protein n=1 Tax=unclassified Fusobacterium TaxID=2648384 RepID=UPI003D2401DC